MSRRELPADPGYMGDPKRGASLGRADIVPAISAGLPGPKWTLQRVRLNSGGYDSGGAYWGVGWPVYWASAIDANGKEISEFFRAFDRADAKNRVRAKHRAAKFYR